MVVITILIRKNVKLPGLTISKEKRLQESKLSKPTAVQCLSTSLRVQYMNYNEFIIKIVGCRLKINSQ